MDTASTYSSEDQGSGGAKSETGLKCLTLGEAISEKKIKEEDASFPPPLFVKAHQRLLKLYDLIDEGTNSVTKVREAAIHNEIERRRKEAYQEFEMECYLARMEKESLELYKELDKKWDTIEEIDDPFDLNAQTMRHREKCNELLKEKNKVIAHLKQLLTERDEDFLKEIDDQGTEIDRLLDMIEKQIIKAKDAYSEELDSLEALVDEEKKSMIESNREKWENLIDEKEQVDKAFIEKICDIIESYKWPMLLAEKSQNDYKRTMRLKLDKYVNDLIVQTDFMKSICTLNIEKLTYNRHLLLKKQEDNSLIKEHCRKYNTRIGNNLSAEKRKIEERRRHILAQMSLYSSKLDKCNKQIILIDKRCDELAIYNAKKYFDLWYFVEKEVEELIEQIHHCDRIIYEECLCIPWVHPDNGIARPTSFMSATKLFIEQKKRSKEETKQTEKSFNFEKQRLFKIVLEALKYSFANNQKKSELPHLSPVDKGLFELNNIFGIIGVETDEHIKSLIKYFLPYVVCPECAAQPVDTGDDSLMKAEDTISVLDRNISNYISSSESTSTISTSDFSEEEDENMQENAKQKFQAVKDIVQDETKFFANDEKYTMKIDPFHYKFSENNPEQDIPIERVLANINNPACGPPCKETDEDLNTDIDTKRNICTEPTHHPYVNPLDITRALEDFTLGAYQSNEREASSHVDEVLRKDRTSASRLMDSGEVTAYWESYLKLFSTKKGQLWVSMISILQDYQKALQKRHDMNVEMQKLRIVITDLTRFMERYSPDLIEPGI